MTFKTCAVVGAAIIAELMFCVLFLASISMASARWTSGSPATHTAESGLHSTKSGTQSAADPVAMATPSPSPSSTSQPHRSDLAQKLAAMRDVHSRISGADTPEAVVALLPDNDRLMHKGLVLMFGMKSGLAAAQVGAVDPREITAEPDPKLRASVRDFVDLMEALMVLKGDRDSAMKGVPGTGAAAAYSTGSRLGLGRASLHSYRS